MRLESGAESTVDEKCVRPLREYKDGEWVAAAAPPAAASNGAPMETDAAPIHPPPEEPTILHPVTVGEAMETTSFDEGLIGSWYEVKIVRLGAEGDTEEGAGPGKVLVTYACSPDEEWVAHNRLRPMPPPTPTQPTSAAWTRWLRAKDVCELRYEQGYWEVEFLSRSGSTLSVLARRYGKVHQVSAAGLRPGWKCQEGGAWEYALGGVTKGAEEWASTLAAQKDQGKKARTSVDPAVAAARELHASNSPLALGMASDLSGSAGGAQSDDPPGDFGWGDKVEVMSNSDGERGCWVPAEACGAPSDEGKLTVAWHEDDSQQATAEINRVRPAAPPVPTGWAANLKAGETIDVFHDNCWWEVILESRKGGKAKVADGPDDPLPREVRLSQLRPRYTWLGWNGGWKYLTEGREVFVSGHPKQMEHNLPPAENEAPERSSKGRKVTKKKDHFSKKGESAEAAAIVPLVDPERVPKVDEYLLVEVVDPADGESVVWKPAIVVECFGRQRFKCMVNGDDDFIEEYGMEDEGEERRKLAEDEIEAQKEAFEAGKVVYQEQLRLENEKLAALAAEAGGAGAAEGGEGGDAAAAGKAPKKKKEGGKKAEGSGPSYEFKFGTEVEVKGRDKGFEGSWYLAEVIKLKEGVSTIQYDALFEKGEEKTEVKETLKSDHLRPKPPELPEGWDEKLSPGTPLELKHEDGWWQVTYVSSRVGTSEVLVKSTHWGDTQHLVEKGDLRPGWKWTASSDSWTIKGPPVGGGGGGGRGGGRGGGAAAAAGGGAGKGEAAAVAVAAAGVERIESI